MSRALQPANIRVWMLAGNIRVKGNIRGNTQLRVAVCCSVLQSVAGCCSVFFTNPCLDVEQHPNTDVANIQTRMLDVVNNIQTRMLPHIHRGREVHVPCGCEGRVSVDIGLFCRALLQKRPVTQGLCGCGCEQTLWSPCEVGCEQTLWM